MAYSSRLLLYIDCFRQTLNTFLFEQYSAHRAHQRCLFSDDVLYKSTLTLLQTSEGEYAVVVVKTHKTSPDVSCWDFVMCSSSGCVCTPALSSRCRQFSRRELRLAVRHCRWVRSAKYRTVLICCACVCVCVCVSTCNVHCNCCQTRVPTEVPTLSAPTPAHCAQLA